MLIFLPNVGVLLLLGQMDVMAFSIVVYPSPLVARLATALMTMLHVVAIARGPWGQLFLQKP
jgi:hypothetical protein